MSKETNKKSISFMVGFKDYERFKANISNNTIRLAESVKEFKVTNTSSAMELLLLRYLDGTIKLDFNSTISEVNDKVIRGATIDIDIWAEVSNKLINMEANGVAPEGKFSEIINRLIYFYNNQNNK